VREKFETNGKLNNFMDGLTRQAGLKPARCKAPERYQQGEEKTATLKMTEKMV